MSLTKPSPRMFARSAYALSAVRNTSQSITAATDTVVIYNSAVFENGSSGAYNTSTGLFTAPFTGDYYIFGSVGYDTNSPGADDDSRIWINYEPSGVDTRLSYVLRPFINATETLHTSAVLNLTAGDELQIEVRNTATRTIGTAESGQRSALDIFLINPT